MNPNDIHPDDRAVDRFAAPTGPKEAADVPWQWWAGDSAELYPLGPYETREEAIAEAVADGLCETRVLPVDDEHPDVWQHVINLVEAQNKPLRLADWIPTDTVLDLANEIVADSDLASEWDDGDYFSVSEPLREDLTARLRRACDDWTAIHGLEFYPSVFSATRNAEVVVIPSETSDAAPEGGAA